MKFQDLFQFNCACFMHKIAYGLQPESFQGMFKPLTGSNRTKNFQLDLLKSKFLAQFPASTLPRIWNTLPLELKHTVKHTSFKNKLCQSLLSQYDKEVHCNDDNCPDCRL